METSVRGDVWDLYMTHRESANHLFRNDGGVFTDVAAAAGVTDASGDGAGVAVADYNNDGCIDMYLANSYGDAFFENNCDGTFTDVTEKSGFSSALGKSLGVVELDFNKDGWSDFAVANDGEGDLLYRNNGDATFTEVGTKSGMAFSEHGEARAGMGIDAGVIDSSGNVSVVVGNFSLQLGCDNGFDNIGVFKACSLF